jgi:thioredoxin reductase
MVARYPFQGIATPMSVDSCQVAVVGAGPYGLAVTAHLRTVGVDVRVFGRAMEFWDRQMPEGMLLRSAWEATHIADPDGALSLDEYQRGLGRPLPRPLPLADFIAYGRWFQRAVVPDLDSRRVVGLERTGHGLQVTLEDAKSLHADRVVVATGLAGFGWRPAEFRHLPPELVSHSSEHADLGAFAGRRVAVVGAGQSALESAALLYEGGAEVEVLARAAAVRWLSTARGSRLSPWAKKLLYPPTDVGPPPLNWLVALPELYRIVPGTLQGRVAYRCIRPAAADWLRERVDGVRITTGLRVVEAAPASEGVRLRLTDDSERTVDHVLLATGYRIDVRRLEFLGTELVAAIQAEDGYPRLARGLEASVPGLHFVGAAAAASFGPVTRFVAGTMYAARALRQRVLEERPASIAEILRAYARQREKVAANAT